MENKLPTEKIPPIVLLLFGALCISFAPVFVKMINLDLLGPTAIGFWRVAIGALILFTWSIVARHSLKISKLMVLLSMIAGFVFALDLFFWHRSIIYCGAGMSTILGNTQVFGTAVLSYFVFKEKPSLIFFITALTAIVGVALLVGVGSEVEFTKRYIDGIIFGLATGAVYSMYLVTLKFAGEKTERPHPITLLAWVSMFTAFFIGIILLIEQVPMMPPDRYSWAVLFSLALVAQSLGWWAISSSIPKLEGARSGLTLLLQPILATVWGVLFFAEQLLFVQIIGAVVTLGAIYVGSVWRKA